MFSKSTCPVALSSNPEGAHFTIKMQNGAPVSTGVTPSTVMLKASNGYFTAACYVIEFNYKGQKQTSYLTAGMNEWYFANFINPLGFIGLMFIDPATGAMWKLDSTVTAIFSITSDAAPKKSVMIVTMDQIPFSMRRRLVAVDCKNNPLL